MHRWLLLEVPGAWERDVGAGAGLPDAARAAAEKWLAGAAERRRLLFIRRPGRTASRALAFVVRAQESDTEVRRLELARLDDLARLDLERAGDTVAGGGLVLVCGHGSRDACCARRGTAVYDRLAAELGDEEVWISSHHGGHRFAANVLVLPAGLHFGRVEPDEALDVVRAGLDRRVRLDRYRGRTCYPPPVQAVEHAIRSGEGLRGVSDVELVGVEGSLVRFRAADGSVHAARVTEIEGPSLPASCGEPATPQPAFRVERA